MHNENKNIEALDGEDTEMQTFCADCFLCYLFPRNLHVSGLYSFFNFAEHVDNFTYCIMVVDCSLPCKPV